MSDHPDYPKTRRLLAEIGAPPELVARLLAEAEAAKRWTLKDDHFHQVGSEAKQARTQLAAVEKAAKLLVRFFDNHPRMAQHLTENALRDAGMDLRPRRFDAGMTEVELAALGKRKAAHLREEARLLEVPPGKEEVRLLEAVLGKEEAARRLEEAPRAVPPDPRTMDGRLGMVLKLLADGAKQMKDGKGGAGDDNLRHLRGALWYPTEKDARANDEQAIRFNGLIFGATLRLRYFAAGKGEPQLPVDMPRIGRPHKAIVQALALEALGSHLDIKDSLRELTRRNKNGLLFVGWPNRRGEPAS